MELSNVPAGHLFFKEKKTFLAIDKFMMIASHWKKAGSAVYFIYLFLFIFLINHLNLSSYSIIYQLISITI